MAPIIGLEMAASGALPDLAAQAVAAEQAGLDFLMLPDVAAYEGAFRHEPFALLAALSAVTTRIGLVVTAALDFNDPFNLARALASLDHLSRGRAGWRAVSGQSSAEARNYGLDAVAPLAERQARAEEMLDVVSGLLDSWDDGAVPRDKATGLFFDRAGMRPVDHIGPHFQVRGPLDIPTAPQRHLPLFSDDGDVGAGHADVICIAAGADPDDIRSTIRLQGRDPSAIKILMRGGAVETPGIDGVILRDLAPAGQHGASRSGLLRTRLGLAPARSRHLEPAHV